MSSSSRQVIVDDNDSSIVYSPNWALETDGSKDSQGNFGTTLKSTLHGTNTNGTFRYQFSGTQITVYGTNNVKNTSSTVVDPSWECLIDHTSIGATPPFFFPENNWILCSANNLADGSHTLTVNTFSQGRHFWFDYLAYTPTNSNDFNDALVMVPSTDLDIVYDSSWQSFSKLGNITSTVGSTATFHFTGTSVTWYGVVPSESPMAASAGIYSIDGGASQPFVLSGLKPTEVTQYNQIFVQTPTLPFGSHNLTVVYGGDQNSTPLTLGYLLVQNSTQESIPSSVSSSSSPSGTAIVSTLAVKVKRTNVAAIVCGVLAAVLVLCLSVFMYLRYIKGRRRPPRWQDVVNPFIGATRPPPRIVESASLSTIGLFGPDDTPSQPRQSTGYWAPPNPQRPTTTRPSPHQNPLPSVPQLQPAPQPLKLTQPISGNREQPQASGSRPPRRPKKKEPPEIAVKDLDENASYYGGYQTWGQTKALEAASGAKARDSYI